MKFETKAGIISGIAGGVLLSMVLLQIDTTDARFARIEISDSDYSDSLSRNEIRLYLYLTNDNGDYVKADGKMRLSVSDDVGSTIYKNSYTVSKDDFITWQNLLGTKQTAYVNDITLPSLQSKEYTVQVYFETKDKSWTDLQSSFELIS